MSHNPEHKYRDTLRDLKLTESSRARIQENLRSYARFHAVTPGVRAEDTSRSMRQVPSRTSFIISLSNLTPKSMTAALMALVLIMGGGTSYAATSAVPGDLLYPVKVGVNEQVRSMIAFSPEAEARLQASLATERLEEAETLAAEGKLTADAASDISARIRAHLTAAEAESIDSEADGDYKSSATVRASLEGTFRTYADVLSELNKEVSGNNGVSLISDIRTYANAAADAQATATAQMSAELKATIENTIDYAAELAERVQKTFDDTADTLTAGARAQVDTKIDGAVTAYTEARIALEAQSYEEAYAAAQTAIRLATQAQTMLTSMGRIQVTGETNAAIDIDTILDVEVEEESTSTTNRPNEDKEENRGRETRQEVRTETSVDTDILDVEVDTSLESGISL